MKCRCVSLIDIMDNEEVFVTIPCIDFLVRRTRALTAARAGAKFTKSGGSDCVSFSVWRLPACQVYAVSTTGLDRLAKYPVKLYRTFVAVWLSV